MIAAATATGANADSPASPASPAIPAPTPGDDAPAPRSGRAALLVACGLIAVAAAPVVLAAINTWGQTYFPAGDQAVMQMRVRDVGLHIPLVGPYSRYVWNHPGPLLYILLAVPYRVLGSRSNGLLAAAAVLNVFSLAGIGAIAWRRGRLPLVVITMVPMAILVHYLTPATLQNPWNPYVTLLPVGLFVFLAWTLIEGDHWAAPVTAFVGSFLVQSHVGYAPLVGGLGLYTLVMTVRRARRSPGGTHAWRRIFFVTGAVFALVWLPVAIDQFLGTGNFSTVLSYFAHSDRTPVGFGPALHFIAREFGNRAPWLGGIEPVDLNSGSVGTRSLWSLALPVGAFVLAWIAAWRTGARAALRFQAVAAVAVVLCYVSLARITDTVFNYLIRWSWVLAAVLWISTAWSLWNAIRRRTGWRARLPAPVRLVVSARSLTVAGLVVLLYIGHNSLDLEVPLPEGWVQPTLAALTPGVVEHTPRGGVIRVRAVGGSVNSATDGLALQLERSTRPVAVEHIDEYKFAAHRTTDADPPIATMWVVYAGAIDEYEIDPGLREIARYEPLSPSERDQHRRDTALLRDELLAIGRPDIVEELTSNASIFTAHGLAGVDQQVVERWERLQVKGDPVAVFIGPPT